MTQPDPQWLDRMYNNRARVPDFALHFAKWVEESVQARESLSGEQDVVYGPDASDVMDIFVPDHPTSGGAPVVVFFYGGSWNSGAREDYAFVGEALASRGIPALRFDLSGRGESEGDAAEALARSARREHHGVGDAG